MTQARISSSRVCGGKQKEVGQMYCADRIGREKNEVDMTGSGDGEIVGVLRLGKWQDYSKVESSRSVGICSVLFIVFVACRDIRGQIVGSA